ncbi:MAG TPA: hypothetical protein VL242_32880 [Sorangium sp.]|nr:hypothetical protein [Sorangium sp.]
MKVLGESHGASARLADLRDQAEAEGLINARLGRERLVLGVEVAVERQDPLEVPDPRCADDPVRHHGARLAVVSRPHPSPDTTARRTTDVLPVRCGTKSLLASVRYSRRFIL